ncbi:Glycosyl transferase family 2 [Novipirellula galeiformis]|uniref:Glycosyl transferase family 2 n=1 Tax=Novipirellula galeiformis TaxID=2528004 RepID=A0A5C6CU38_9BACT|nr:glycosyltransferase [Novipirellula galeiformis]TWU27164.1 Glycosyl transferase family 2 [Novipirellula galeiformis]
MSTSTLPLTIAIPTLGREQVLVDTIQMLLDQTPRASEILVVDQSAEHDPSVAAHLAAWHHDNHIVWLQLDKASQPGALNEALRRASQEFVLFLDDDIRIDSGFLAAHMDGFSSDEIWAVAGQVLQPGENPDDDYVHTESNGCFADADFRFRSNRPAMIENAMSGNMTVRRQRALQVGGFDENFTPPVAYRFDNEFSKRLCKSGGKIAFLPKARIYHLRAPRGGTRSNSNHLTSMSPEHGIGDHYFALLHGRGLKRWTYISRRMVREVCTRFHLKHPWWIPVKFIGETRAFIGAIALRVSGPRLIQTISDDER